MTDISKNELLELELAYWQAMKDQDAEAASRLTSDPCIVTGSQGVSSLARETLTSMLVGANWRIVDFELSDVQMQKLSEDVAVVAYIVREELTVDGEPVSIDAADASTWVRHDGGWQCALHTESLIGDPFGRDRTADAF
jgi:hypothetical protein